MWDKFIEGLTKIDSTLNGIVWGWPVIILILGTGLLLSIRTGFLQLSKFGDSWRSTIIPVFKSIGKKKEKKKEEIKGENSVTPFQAFSTAISGTVGTGNIVGVTAAILSGGPGAVVWMWICAFFGMVTNYSENVLGLFYRKKDSEGNLSGGAFYYIKNGLKQKGFWGGVTTFIAYFAAFVTLFAAVGMSGVQTNKISGAFSASLNNLFGIGADDASAMRIKLIVGIIVGIITAIVIIGGIKRISRVASNIIPFMSLLFIILAIIGIIMNGKNIGGAFGLIFGNAFRFKAAAGGVLGYAFSTVIKKGMARGVFSNEAGLGSSVIAHSASATREPVIQGLWGVFEVFFDTFIICTLTALLFITTFYDKLTGTAAETMAALDDSAMAMGMFSENFGAFGTVCYLIILPLFAFTTILAWSYYGEKACEFFFGWAKTRKAQKTCVLVFKIIYIAFVVAAAVINSSLVWSVDDTFNGLMALPNLIGVILLSGTVVKITKNYYDRKNGKDVEPMLSAYPELNEEFKSEL